MLVVVAAEVRHILIGRFP